MAATTLSPVETWTILERIPRTTNGLLGSLHRDIEPGVVARTTDGESYRLVRRLDTPRYHVVRGQRWSDPFPQTWEVEWVGLRFNREQPQGKPNGRIEFRNRTPELGLRTLTAYAYKVAA